MTDATETQSDRPADGADIAPKDRSVDPDIMCQFHGSEHWYKHWVPGITFTDGAK
jgi:hypothetical protein